MIFDSFFLLSNTNYDMTWSISYFHFYKNNSWILWLVRYMDSLVLFQYESSSAMLYHQQCSTHSAYKSEKVQFWGTCSIGLIIIIIRNIMITYFHLILFFHFQNPLCSKRNNVVSCMTCAGEAIRSRKEGKKITYLYLSKNQRKELFIQCYC